MTNSRWSAALLLVVVFSLGAGAGALGMQRSARCSGMPARGPNAYLDRLTRELSLSEPQQQQVKAVLDRFTPRMEALDAETRPRFEQMRTEIRTEIRSLLTEPQRTRYEEMIRRHDAERNARATRSR